MVVANGRWRLRIGTMGQSLKTIDRHAQVAQSVEHVLGKDEVSGSIPLLGFAQFATFWVKVITSLGDE